MPDLDVEIRRYTEALVESVPAVTALEARQRVARSPFRRLGVASNRFLAIAAAMLAILGFAGVTAAVRVAGTRTTVAADGPLPLPLTLDGHLEWFLSLYNGAHTPNDAEIETRFAASFVDEIAPAEIRDLAAEVRADGAPADGAPPGWVVKQEIERRETTLATQLVAANGMQARLSLMVDQAGQIVFYTIKPAGESCTAMNDREDVQVPQALASRLVWLMGTLNSTAPLTDEEVSDVFAPSFLERVAPDRLRRVVSEVRTDAPLTIRHFERAAAETALEVRLGTDTGRETRLALVIDRQEPHQITRIEFLPNPPPCSVD